MASWELGLFYAALVTVSINVVIWLIATHYHRLAKVALLMISLGWLLLSLSIIVRIVITGHGPFSNIYEFSLAFAWGIMVIGLLLWWRNRVNMIIGLTSVLCLGFLIFAATISSSVTQLVPALQQSALLSLHVASAAIAYGAFAVGFGISVVYLFRRHNQIRLAPESDILDHIGYQSVMVGFPFMTLTIISGAVWAEIAWGRFWGWDPKETASLVTCLIYAGYLHVRILHSWRGKKSAVFLILGFCSVIFTFIGNYIFQGLHSYL